MVKYKIFWSPWQCHVKWFTSDLKKVKNYAFSSNNWKLYLNLIEMSIFFPKKCRKPHRRNLQSNQIRHDEHMSKYFELCLWSLKSLAFLFLLAGSSLLFIDQRLWEVFGGAGCSNFWHRWKIVAETILIWLEKFYSN